MRTSSGSGDAISLPSNTNRRVRGDESREYVGKCDQHGIWRGYKGDSVKFDAPTTTLVPGRRKAMRFARSPS
jgi:hypothetical protein